MSLDGKKVDHLVVDTTAFIQNAPLQEIAQNVYTVKEVVEEIKNKRQLKRLCVLPYDLVVKTVFSENVVAVTEFAKKTGDYPSLSATDIKVMALTYQLEKENVGKKHVREEPVCPKSVKITLKKNPDMNPAVVGFYVSGKSNKSNKSNKSEQTVESSEDDEEISRIDDETKTISDSENDENVHQSEIDKKLLENFCQINLEEIEKLTNFNDENESHVNEDILIPTEDYSNDEDTEEDESEDLEDDEDEGIGWITPSNIKQIKKQINSEVMEEKQVKVACMTTDFAMQNVLKQMNLNVSSLDGRIIKQLRTYILRCYACFKTTSVMTSKFCPKCGNSTLKKVSVSVDANGKQIIHINARKPLTNKGKIFSLPTPQGGKHSNNPMLAADQRFPHQRPTRLARTKANTLEDDFITISGYSPFVQRDVTSKAACLGIRGDKQEMKHWMMKNPNEAKRRSKKKN